MHARSSADGGRRNDRRRFRTELIGRRRLRRGLSILHRHHQRQQLQRDNGAFPLGAEEHVFLLTQHHIVSDGWSMGVLTNELSALYAATGGVDFIIQAWLLVRRRRLAVAARPLHSLSAIVLRF